jgi:hypothetical protein
MKKAPALLLKSNFPVINTTGDERQAVISQQFCDRYAAVLWRPVGPGVSRARHLLIDRGLKLLALVVGIRRK